MSACITIMTTLALRREAASFAANAVWGANGNRGHILRSIAERTGEQVSGNAINLAVMVDGDIVSLASLRLGACELHPLDPRKQVESRLQSASRPATQVAFLQLFQSDNAVESRSSVLLLRAAVLAARRMGADTVVAHVEHDDEKMDGLLSAARLCGGIVTSSPGPLRWFAVGIDSKTAENSCQPAIPRAAA